MNWLTQHVSFYCIKCGRSERAMVRSIQFVRQVHK